MTDLTARAGFSASSVARRAPLPLRLPSGSSQDPGSAFASEPSEQAGGGSSVASCRAEEAGRLLSRLKSQGGGDQPTREALGVVATGVGSPSKESQRQGSHSKPDINDPPGQVPPSPAERASGATVAAEGEDEAEEEPFPAKRLGLLALGCLSLVVVGRATGATEELSAEHIGRMVRGAGVFGCLVVAVVMSLGELVHVPAVIVYGACIMIYGKAVGFLVGWFAVLTSVNFTFFVVRTVGGRGLAQMKNRRVKAVLAHLDKRPFTVILMLRVVLFAAPLLNYALALSGVSFKNYFAGSAIGIIPPLAFIAVTIDQFMMVHQLIHSENTLSPSGQRVGLRGHVSGVFFHLGNASSANGTVRKGVVFNSSAASKSDAAKKVTANASVMDNASAHKVGAANASAEGPAAAALRSATPDASEPSRAGTHAGTEPSRAAGAAASKPGRDAPAGGHTDDADAAPAGVSNGGRGADGSQHDARQPSNTASLVAFLRNSSAAVPAAGSRDAVASLPGSSDLTLNRSSRSAPAGDAAASRTAPKFARESAAIGVLGHNRSSLATASSALAAATSSLSNATALAASSLARAGAAREPATAAGAAVDALAGTANSTRALASAALGSLGQAPMSPAMAALGGSAAAALRAAAVSENVTAAGLPLSLVNMTMPGG